MSEPYPVIQKYTGVLIQEPKMYGLVIRTVPNDKIAADVSIIPNRAWIMAVTKDQIPNRFRRFWQWFFFGWKWRILKPGQKYELP